MSSGRVDRQRRRRRGESPAKRRFERVRRSSAIPAAARRTARRPGVQSATWSGSASGTGGAFKLSSTRRASVLAILVCAMALSVSVPLRTYLSQRDELAAQEHHRAELARQVQDLEHRKEALSDPAHFEAEVRRRLGYVRPGETPYIVQAPEAPAGPAPAPPPPPARSAPWYQELWSSVSGGES